MKTFLDLKEGDYIYYYDHYKIRKQKVHKIEIIKETKEENSWYYNAIITRTYEWLIIEAGHGTKIKYNINYIYDDKTMIWHGGIKRFSDIEACHNHILKMKQKRIQAKDKAYNRYLKESKILEKYPI